LLSQRELPKVFAEGDLALEPGLGLLVCAGAVSNREG
jgi:hypothetical protein